MHLDGEQPQARLQRGRIVTEEDNTAYILLKDGREVDRLNLQHWVMKKVLGRNVFAPVRHPRTVLDVACGTCIWPREQAEYWKQAQVYGFDFDAKPYEQALARGMVFPRNFHFQEADALQRFPYEDGVFNYSHARLISAFVSRAAWPHILTEMLRVTAPGGWIEHLESEIPECPGKAFNQIRRAVVEMLATRQHTLDVPMLLGAWLRAAGLERVEAQRVVIAPPSDEPALVRATNRAVLGAWHGMQKALIGAGVLSPTESLHLMEQVVEEIDDLGTSVAVTIAYGQKPRKPMDTVVSASL